MLTGQEFGITAKLVEVRDTMRGLLGDGYADRCAEYRIAIKREMADAGCSPLLAATRMIQRDWPDNGSVQAMLVSAAVEILESGNNT